MKHLSPQQFIGIIDGTPGPASRAHLETCAECRLEVGDLQAITAAVVRSAAAPAPSPLFWDHLSTRVQRAVAVEALPGEAWWHAVWRPVLGVGMALACLALVVLVQVTGVRPEAPVATVANVNAAASPSPDQADQPWQFVLQIASSASPADLDRMSAPTADATAAMVESLTPSEREALVRLLKARMGAAE
jgi:hypothetical protein